MIAEKARVESRGTEEISMRGCENAVKGSEHHEKKRSSSKCELLCSRRMSKQQRNFQKGIEKGREK